MGEVESRAECLALCLTGGVKMGVIWLGGWSGKSPPLSKIVVESVEDKLVLECRTIYVLFLFIFAF